MSITLNKYRDGESITAEVLNRPISQLEAEINSLRSQVSGITSQGRVVVEGLTSGDGVSVGDVVCLLDSGRVGKALAHWSRSHGSQGETQPGEFSRVMGVVVSQAGSLVSVVTNGLLSAEHSAAATALVGANPDPGTYYLSASEAGRVVATRHDAMPLPVVSVDSQGRVLINPVTNSTGHHAHRKYDVPLAGWVEAGGRKTYSNGVLAELAYHNITDCTVVVDGVISDVFSLDIVDGAVELSASVSDFPDVESGIVVYSSVPFPADPPVVRAVEAVGPRLRARSSNGVVTITLDRSEAGVSSPSGSAVSRLNDDGTYDTTPVISGISTDGSISMQSLGNGKVSLSARYGGGQALRPHIVSMNGVTVAEVQSQLMYVFPAVGRPVSLLGTLPIEAPPDDSPWSVYPYVQLAAAGVSTYSANFLVSVTFAPLSDLAVSGGSPSTVAVVPGTPLPGSPNLTGTVPSGQMASFRTDSPVVVDRAGTLTVKLQATTSTNYTVVGFGVVVNP